MIPTKRHQFEPSHNLSSPVMRAMRAVFCEGRMPYAMSSRLDRWLAKLGWEEKICKHKGYSVIFRRCTSDESFVQNVFIEEEYFRPGYRPEIADTVIDIGGNIGCFALAASRYVRQGKIISIEPFPANINLFRRNIAKNKIANILLCPAAVSSLRGSVPLYVGNDTGMHSVKFDTGRGVIEVPALRLQDIFEMHNVETCHLLKIDCEGAEFDFLPAVDSRIWQKIERVVIEFTAPIPEWKFHDPSQEHIALKLAYGEQLVRLLESHEFHIDHYEDCVGFRAGYIFARKKYVNTV